MTCAIRYIRCAIAIASFRICDDCIINILMLSRFQMLDSTIELCLHMISNFREALGKVTGATLDCARGYFEEGRFEGMQLLFHDSGYEHEAFSFRSGSDRNL